MTTSTRTPRISADRAARFIERSIASRALDAATAADAAALLDAIDGGTVRGLSGAVEALLDVGFRRGALAVASADGNRKRERTAVAGIRAVAALAGALGLGVTDDAANEPAAEVDLAVETVSEIVPAEEPIAPAWGVA